MVDVNRPAVRHLWKTGVRLGSVPRRAMAKTQFPLRAAPTPRGVTPLPRKLGSNYDTNWARRYPARVVRKAAMETVGRGIASFYGNPTMFNADRLEGLAGPAIFACNHHSHADTLMMKIALPKPWRDKVVIAAASDYFFASHAGAAVSALFIGAIPIEREAVSRRTIAEPIFLLRMGWSMVIFPEGGRGTDGWGREFKAGVAFLSKQTNVPVVPVHIEGTATILPKGKNWPNRSHVTINFGTPMWFGEGDRNRSFAERIEHEVAVLADEDTTDWWSARLRAHQGSTPSLRGPDVSPWRRQWSRGNRRRIPASRTERRWPFI